jgi:rRNA maturation endonuclease Nob1
MRKKVENIMNQAAKSFREYEKAKEECKSRYEKTMEECRKPAETHQEKAELLPIDGKIKKVELTCMRCSKCKKITAVADYCQWCGSPINYEAKETEAEEDHES